MEVSRVGVESELQLQATAIDTAIATANPATSVTYTAPHSNAESLATDQGQGLNPHPHGY